MVELYLSRKAFVYLAGLVAQVQVHVWSTHIKWWESSYLPEMFKSDAIYDIDMAK